MLRVILADDEQYERNYLEKVIKESYPGLLEIVCKAVDGMDLLEKLEECKPQIVLLDIKMPRMDGLKTAEEVRKRYPDIQIVLISAALTMMSCSPLLAVTASNISLALSTGTVSTNKGRARSTGPLTRVTSAPL